MADGAELAQWVRLERTDGVGPQAARRLLAAFGLPANIFSAGRAELERIVPPRIARALAAPPPAAIAQLADRTVAWAEQTGNRVLTLADADYPASLLHIPDPPVMLYVKGRCELLGRPALAIVGSRNASAQGRANADNCAGALSAAGLAIVSGLALGIDAAAHLGGLREAGSTIAVIGTGADIVYPATNRALAHRIANEGCLVSEYALGMPAMAANFPRRNRIISGLARGVLVVEAAARSGSLITARMAAEQGREVFALPGSIHSPLAKGCHELIRQGAVLVESAADILDELGRLPAPACAAPAGPPPVACNAQARALLACLGHDPVDANLLAERAGLDPATITARLLMLELDGLVEMLPGGIWRAL
jgi:DNA processing protein